MATPSDARLRQHGRVGPTIPHWIAAALLFAAAGCSRGGPEIVRVRGTVTRHGAAVPNLTVNFMPEKGRPSWGLTDAEGRYALHYTAKRDGAVVGKHRVFVVFRGAPGPEAELALFRGKVPPPHPDAAEIRKRFGKLETTTLEADVRQDGQVVDLELD